MTRRTLGLALVVVLVAAGYLAFISHEGDARLPSTAGESTVTTGSGGALPTDPVSGDAEQHEGRSRERSSVGPDATSVADSAGGSSLGVMSDRHLDLSYIEVRTAGGWTRHEVEAGRVRFDRPTGAFEVRAPGHRSAVVPAGTHAVLLNADLWLELTCPALRQVLVGASVLEWTGDSAESVAIRELIACGVTDEVTYCIAIRNDCVPRIPAQTINVDLRFVNGERVGVTFGPRQAPQGPTALRCPPAGADRSVANLDVEVVDLDRVPGQRHEVRVWTSNDDPHQVEQTSWGQIEYWGTAIDESALTDLDTHACSFAALPVGKRIGTFARNPATGAHARRWFIHDGTKQALQLGDGVRLIGRVTGDPQFDIVRSIGASWMFVAHDDGERLRAALWSGEARRIDLGPDGGFSIALPQRALMVDQEVEPPPPELRLSLMAPGYVPHAMTLQCPASGDVQCGDIQLVPRPSAFELASCPLLDNAALASTLVYVPTPGPAFEIESSYTCGANRRAVTIAMADEGGLDAKLLRAWSEDHEQWEAAEWPEVPPSSLVLKLDADDYLGCVRGIEGAFTCVPTERRTIKLHVLRPLSANEHIVVGFRWNGVAGRIPLDALEAARGKGVSVGLPAKNTVVWCMRRTEGAVVGARPIEVQLTGNSTVDIDVP